MPESSVVKALRKKLEKVFDENLFDIHEQDSFNDLNETLKNIFSKASKRLTGNKGRPEFVILPKENKNNIVFVFECKKDISKHRSSKFDYNNKDNISDFAVDGALHYSKHLKDNFNVFAIAASGDAKNMEISTFFQEKNSETYEEILDFNKIKDFEVYLNYMIKEQTLILTQEEIRLELQNINQIMQEMNLQTNIRTSLISAILAALKHPTFYNMDWLSLKTKAQLIDMIIQYAEFSFRDAFGDEKAALVKSTFSFRINKSFEGDLDKNDRNSNSLIVILDKLKKIFKSRNKRDVLTLFYQIFTSSSNEGNELGIVTTDSGYMSLMIALSEPSISDKYQETGTGPGGFSIQLMNEIESLSSDSKLIENFRRENVMMVEYQASLYALLLTNLLLNDYNSANTFYADVFTLEKELKEFGYNKSLSNPPYGLASKMKNGKHELEFLKNQLDNSLPNGINVSIIPIGSLMPPKHGNQKINTIRKELLSRHSILAVMTLNEKVFHNSNISIKTAIIVSKAHDPHITFSNDGSYRVNRETWFADWRNDGLETVQNVGRYDALNKFQEIKETWVSDYLNKTERKNYSFSKKISLEKGWHYTAVEDSDWSNLSYREGYEYITREILEGLKNSINFNDVEKISTDGWKLFKISDIFSVIKGGGRYTRVNAMNADEGDYDTLLTGRGLDYIVGRFKIKPTDKKSSIIVGTQSGVAHYIKEDFVAGTGCNVLSDDKITDKNQLLLRIIMNDAFKNRYDRYHELSQSKLKEFKLLLPATEDGFIDWVAINRISEELEKEIKENSVKLLIDFLKENFLNSN